MGRDGDAVAAFYRKVFDWAPQDWKGVDGQYARQVEGLDPAVMTATEPAYESDSELMGAGGTFTFTAVAAGETQLRLVCLQPWEQVEPLETFTMAVTVP